MSGTLSRHRLAGGLIVLVAFVVWWIGSEVWYARSIRPGNIKSVADYGTRFGAPRAVYKVEREGRTHYVLGGRGPAVLLLAAPSSPPEYVFDERGRFLEWCPDRGETSSDFNGRWPLKGRTRIETESFTATFRSSF